MSEINQMHKVAFAEDKVFTPAFNPFKPPPQTASRAQLQRQKQQSYIAKAIANSPPVQLPIQQAQPTRQTQATSLNQQTQSIQQAQQSIQQAQQANQPAQQAPTSQQTAPPTEPPTEQNTTRVINLKDYLRQKAPTPTESRRLPTINFADYKLRAKPTEEEDKRKSNNQPTIITGKVVAQGSLDIRRQNAASIPPRPSARTKDKIPLLCPHGRQKDVEFCKPCALSKQPYAESDKVQASTASQPSSKPSNVDVRLQNVELLCTHGNKIEACALCRIQTPSIVNDPRLRKTETTPLCPHGRVNDRDCPLCAFMNQSVRPSPTPSPEAGKPNANPGKRKFAETTKDSIDAFLDEMQDDVEPGTADLPISMGSCSHYQPPSYRGPCRICGVYNPPPEKQPKKPEKESSDKRQRTEIERHGASVKREMIAESNETTVQAEESEPPQPFFEDRQPQRPVIKQQEVPAYVDSPPRQAAPQPAFIPQQSAAFVDDDDKSSDEDVIYDLPPEPSILIYTDAELYDIIWFFGIKLSKELVTMKAPIPSKFNNLGHFNDLIKKITKASKDFSTFFNIVCQGKQASVTIGTHKWLMVEDKNIENVQRAVLTELYQQGLHWQLLTKNIQNGKYEDLTVMFEKSRTIEVSTKFTKLSDGTYEYVKSVYQVQFGRAVHADLATAKVNCEKDAWDRLNRICQSISFVYRPPVAAPLPPELTTQTLLPEVSQAIQLDTAEDGFITLAPAAVADISHEVQVADDTGSPPPIIEPKELGGTPDRFDSDDDDFY
ncbi:hypothetical protein THRCLA_10712 [Thraustotheca clavata]|uniref:Uncharacterized protein n=1 Tax=Thraustotheca clavata TaxID=74557 RepID=A0A1V9YI23_9STRA|nr:hypothetical protein THRCLA_10712 [Thraustotheca clavata]